MSTRGDEVKNAAQVAAQLSKTPTKRSMSLIKQRGSLRTTIMAEALREEDIEPSRAGSADQYYFEEDGVVVIDLRSDGVCVDE